MQQTIKGKIKLSGLSVRGKNCEAFLLPAEVDTGLCFRFNDGLIKAGLECVDPASNNTTSLLRNGFKVETVEHLLGALWGMGVDNVIIDLMDGYIPFRDFSAKYFCEEIEKIGVEQQEAKRKYFDVKSGFRVEEVGDDRYATVEPNSGGMMLEAVVDFPEPMGVRGDRFNSASDGFLKNISWARSFVRSSLDDNEKWERIRKIYPMLPQDPQDSPLIVYNKSGFITELLLENEPAKHKILDFFGDISLLGYRVKGSFYLYKPGHRFNYEIAKKIADNTILV